jgi:ubiquinone/menaquinone biosynthesis C-methylase UbiE
MNPKDKKTMLMNWPERVFISSPVRLLVQHRQASKWIRLAGPRRTETALEIGCGLGRGAQIAVNRLGAARMFAFDLEEDVVHKAGKRLPAELKGRISFFVGDAQDFPFPDTSFDAVINYGIIHHVLDWRRCISEIGRVLKTGGLFYFEEIYPPLYANPLMRHLVRHPETDRFEGSQFIAALEANHVKLLPGVRTDSRFGIVGVARKELTPDDRPRSTVS